MQKLNNHRVVKKGQNPGALVFHPKPASKIELITGNENMGEDETVRNCIGCGFIYTSAKYAELDSCAFCARPLTMKSKKENRRRREEGEDEQGLIKAEQMRDRLVASDMEARGLDPRRRNVVTDDDIIQ